MAKDINAIIEDIINDAENVGRSAVKNASKAIQKDIQDNAIKVVQRYYDDYDTTRYDRLHLLFKTISPYYNDMSRGNNMAIEIGITFDYSVMEGLHKSNSWYHQFGDKWVSRKNSSFNWHSQDNGIPQADWIFDNFMEGIHPGSDTTTSPKKLMDNYMDKELPNKINSYVQEAIFNEFASRLK